MLPKKGESEKFASLEMFYGVLGTWIPFALIFSFTCLTGLHISRRPAVGSQ